MNIQRVVIAITLVGLLTGCQTTTRFGDILIPAHPDSYKAKDDKIVFMVKEVPPQAGFAALPLALGAAQWLADQAQKKIADELRNEAKKYTQQYSGKFRRGFAPGTYHVAMLRLIPGKPSFDDAATNRLGDTGLAPIIKDAEQDGKNRGFSVASAVMFELQINSDKGEKGTNNWGYLDLKEVYLSKAKAKVVGLSAWPWHWLGALILKTGYVVQLDVHARVKGITEKGVLALVDEDFPENGQKLKLGKPVIASSDNLGDWMLMGGMGSIVPLTFDIRVTERDPSNVQKLLQDSADKVEKSSFLKDLVPKD